MELGRPEGKAVAQVDFRLPNFTTPTDISVTKVVLKSDDSGYPHAEYRQSTYTASAGAAFFYVEECNPFIEDPQQWKLLHLHESPSGDDRIPVPPAVTGYRDSLGV